MTELEEWFYTYHHRYFDGRLKPCSVQWAALDSLGLFVGDKPGDLRDPNYTGPYHILINRKLKWSNVLWHMTLLHEMVHLKLAGKERCAFDKHSRMFNREMKKLAARGAFVGLW